MTKGKRVSPSVEKFRKDFDRYTRDKSTQKQELRAQVGPAVHNLSKEFQKRMIIEKGYLSYLSKIYMMKRTKHPL